MRPSSQGRSGRRGRVRTLVTSPPTRVGCSFREGITKGRATAGGCVWVGVTVHIDKWAVESSGCAGSGEWSTGRRSARGLSQEYHERGAPTGPRWRPPGSGRGALRRRRPWTPCGPEAPRTAPSAGDSVQGRAETGRSATTQTLLTQMRGPGCSDTSGPTHLHIIISVKSVKEANEWEVGC